jgi:hypothetical protein
MQPEPKLRPRPFPRPTGSPCKQLPCSGVLGERGARRAAALCRTKGEVLGSYIPAFRYAEFRCQERATCGPSIRQVLKRQVQSIARDGEVNRQEFRAKSGSGFLRMWGVRNPLGYASPVSGSLFHL